MSSFQNLGVIRTLQAQRSYAHALTFIIQRGMNPLRFCLWVIMNQKSFNLETTTSSVRSVLLLIIYNMDKHQMAQYDYITSAQN